MRGSEALLRAIAGVGGDIPATQFDSWLSQLLKAGLLEKDVRDDHHVFHYRLTRKAKVFLRSKGVEL